MGIERVGTAWNEYCSQNAILKILLPISMPLLMATAGLRVLQYFIKLGSVAETVVYVLFILSVLLMFAKSEYRMLSIGIGVYMIAYIVSFLRTLIKYHSFGWSSIIYILIWGFFAFMAYKKSIKLGGN